MERIAKLELTQSNAQQNIEQLQNPTIGVTLNNESSLYVFERITQHEMS